MAAERPRSQDRYMEKVSRQPERNRITHTETKQTQNTEITYRQGT